jgi:hypothetical protein
MQLVSAAGTSWSGHEALLLSSCSRHLGLRSCISLARSCRLMAGVTNPISDSNLGGFGPATGAAALKLRCSSIRTLLSSKRHPCSRLSASAVGKQADGLLPAHQAFESGTAPSSVGSFLEHLKSGGSVPPAPVCNHFLRGDWGRDPQSLNRGRGEGRLQGTGAATQHLCSHQSNVCLCCRLRGDRAVAGRVGMLQAAGVIRS